MVPCMRFKGAAKSSGTVKHQSSCCNAWGCSLSLYRPFTTGELHRVISTGWKARKTAMRNANDFKLAEVACLGLNSWLLFTAGQGFMGRFAQSLSKIITLLPKEGDFREPKITHRFVSKLGSCCCQKKKLIFWMWDWEMESKLFEIFQNGRTLWFA